MAHHHFTKGQLVHYCYYRQCNGVRSPTSKKGTFIRYLKSALPLPKGFTGSRMCLVQVDGNKNPSRVDHLSLYLQ